MNIEGLCEVYKSLKEKGVYLFVMQQQGLADVPEELLTKLGDLQRVTSFMLTPDKKLARTNGQQVMAAIDTQGFYLQMPMSPEEYMTRINRQNSKL